MRRPFLGLYYPPSICLVEDSSEMNQTHPKGIRARVLLSSVFGPYAQDDEFGSRTINPMELYHNQVTRAQGSFSVRRFHRSWGILMIQENHFRARARSWIFPRARHSPAN